MNQRASMAKSVTGLSEADFLSFPVWEYATSEEGVLGQDETWVRPCTASSSVPRGRYSQLVAAEFQTPTGQRLNGFMAVTTVSKSPEIDPGALLISAGYFPLPSLSRADAERGGHMWQVEEREAILLALGRLESQVFPLSYRFLLPVPGLAAGFRGVLP
jgi:hypothetical protein